VLNRHSQTGKQPTFDPGIEGDEQPFDDGLLRSGTRLDIQRQGSGCGQPGPAAA
jgi:hypothetical protein